MVIHSGKTPKMGEALLMITVLRTLPSGAHNNGYREWHL
jgi:hypothetical protein